MGLEAKMPDSIDSAMETTELVGISHTARVASPRTRAEIVSSPFVIYDIRNSYVSSPAKREELATLYREVFNGVPDVTEKWGIKSASQMIDARLRKFGCNIVLVDITRGKIIGGFFSNIVPGAYGWNLSEPDVFLAEQYRNNKSAKLGTYLGWMGRKYANEIVKARFGELLVANESKTYRKPVYPRSMWKAKGYEFQSLFTKADREISRPNRETLRQLDMPDITRRDLPEIVNFIADSNSVIASDGHQWSRKAAEAYVEFMYVSHPGTFIVARSGDEILSVGSADIMPGRSGATLVESRMFVKDFSKTNGDQHNSLTVEEIAAASFGALFNASNAVSKASFEGEAISTMEFPESSAGFFRRFLPGLSEDDEFLAMVGDHEVLMERMRPDTKMRRKSIPLIGNDSGTAPH